MDEITLRIDGREVRAKGGATLLMAAQKAGIYIPSLCDHPDLTPIGHCRLCLVKVEGADDFLKPVTDGRIGKRHLVFHAGDLAFAADEGFDEVQLLRGHTGESAVGEAALDGCVAGLAVQTGDGQFAITDGTFAQGCFHGLLPVIGDQLIGLPVV